MPRDGFPIERALDEMISEETGKKFQGMAVVHTQIFVSARLIGDKAYDLDALDKKLAQEYDIELIAPNRQRRSQTQDRRKLRRYRRRWKVERLFAWMMKSSESAMEFFRLPTNRVIELGSQLRI